MKLDLNFKFKNIDGTEITEGNNAAKLAADILCGRTEGISPIKAYDIAVTLYKEGSIELDRTDLDAVENAINAAAMPNIGKAQLLSAIKAAKETATE